MSAESIRAQRRRARERMSPEERHVQQFTRKSNARAKSYGSGDRISPDEIRPIVGPCWRCGAVATEWDHVIPLRAGGANRPDNIKPSCGPCNRRQPQPWQRDIQPIVGKAKWERMGPDGRHAMQHKLQDARYGANWTCKRCALGLTG